MQIEAALEAGDVIEYMGDWYESNRLEQRDCKIEIGEDEDRSPSVDGLCNTYLCERIGEASCILTWMSVEELVANAGEVSAAVNGQTL